MFWTLPQEVFDLILDQLGPSDVKALSQVSRSLNAALAPIIWKGIRVDVRSRTKEWEPPPENRTDAEAMARCAAAFGHPSPATRHATRLTLECRYRSLDRNQARCPHFSKEERDSLLKPSGFLSLPDNKDAKYQEAALYEARHAAFQDIGRNATLVVEGLQEHQLHAFSWDFGACVPPDLIRSLGRRQAQLESLYLDTSTWVRCWADHEDKAIDLSPFRELKRISWRSPPPENLHSLARAILDNRLHLEQLELALPHWNDLRRYINPNEEARELDPLVDVVLSAKVYKSPEPMLPSLRVLSLNSVKICCRSVRKLLQTVNFGALESLALVDCDGCEVLLEGLLDVGTALRLKTFELMCDGPHYSECPVAEFIRSFKGLEELYICAAQYYSDTACVWRAAARHRKTLRRFVYHKRTPVPRALQAWTDFPLWDSRSVEIPALGLSEQRQDPRVNPLYHMQLECLGLCGQPGHISWHRLLRPFTKNPTLKLLHLRQTGSDKAGYGSRFLDFPRSGLPGEEHREDRREAKAIPHDILQGVLSEPFLDLVNWAFGPKGVPSLQVIACGDFAHRRSPQYLHNVFVCRKEERREDSEPVYRVSDPRDEERRHEWADLVRPYWRMLEAGPVAPYAPFPRYFD